MIAGALWHLRQMSLTYNAVMMISNIEFKDEMCLFEYVDFTLSTMLTMLVNEFLFL